MLAQNSDENKEETLWFAEFRLWTQFMPGGKTVVESLDYSIEGPDAKKTACYDIDVEVVSILLGYLCKMWYQHHEAREN